MDNHDLKNRTSIKLENDKLFRKCHVYINITYTPRKQLMILV